MGLEEKLDTGDRLGDKSKSRRFTSIPFSCPRFLDEPDWLAGGGVSPFVLKLDKEERGVWSAMAGDQEVHSS